jgi:bis(5'-adenosyl)-triphosphatase
MFAFGPRIRIPAAQVFHTTELSYCFVNLSPVVPGHVLVAPKAERRRVNDMTDAETSDLLVVGRFVARITERVYGASASTFVVQDGVDAGQTVAHVHLHVMPRRPGERVGEGKRNRNN